jgi:hypothetical protein
MTKITAKSTLEDVAAIISAALERASIAAPGTMLITISFQP